MTRKLLALTLLAAFATASGACSRSARYRDDQDYYKDPGPRSAGDSATARAERFGQPKKRLYVLPFENVTPVGGPEFGEFAADELMREIRTHGRAALVPENLKTEQVSADFYSGEKVRLGPLVREGRRLGVAFLVIGRIKKVTYRSKGDDVGLFRQKQAIAAVDVEMRLFDVLNSKEVLLDQRSADSSANQVDVFSDDSADPKSQRAELVRMALRASATLLAKDTRHALEKLSWEGRIAKIVGNQIYVNAGRATGLNLGDVLKVLTVGEDVYDPVTGAYMGRARGQPKGTLEVVDYLGTDGAVTVVHSGGNFSENDIVQLY